MEKIKVLLAEDHTIVRKGLRSLLDQDFNITVVGEAADGHETIKKVTETRPDIVILDISLPLLNGLEVARQLLTTQPEIKILILSMYNSEELIFEAVSAGVKGYVLKNAAPDELTASIRTVFFGKTYFSPSIKPLLSERIEKKGKMREELAQQSVLTNREREVIQLIAEGYSSREIAKMLKLSIKTIENHRTNIMNKLKMNKLTDLVKYAIRNRIIHLES